jgi:regulator of protease activity HflC (stomatin/prohibitin superfamily)
MGQEVLQMINGGFNPLQEISRTTGISMVELKKRMEDGQISAEMVAKAFQTATSEGGLFFGMNERLSQSMSGQFAKMESEIKAAAISLGTDLMPMLKQVTGMIREGIGGEGGGERGILGFNIKLASDAYASLFAGIGTGIESAAESVRNLDITSGLVGAVMDGLNATLDKSQEIKDAELDREAALIRAANQEGEITKKKAEQIEQSKKLAEAEMERTKAENVRVNTLKADIEFQKKTFGDLSKLREEYDKLTLGDDEARRQ